MLTLPDDTSLSRGPLRGFWLAGCLLVGLVTIAPGGLRAGRRRRVSAALLAVAGMLGMVRPSIARRPYLTWNRWVRAMVEPATTYTAWVAHLTALPERVDHERVAGGPPRRGSAAGWRPARGPLPAASRSPSPRPVDELATTRPWLASWRWLAARGEPRHRWLLLCLALLRWLGARDPEATAAPPTENYTLY